MRLRTLIETSIAVKLLRKLLKGYGYFEEAFGSASQKSLIYKPMPEFWNKVKIYSRYSFLGRASEIKKRDATFIISESRVIGRIRDACNKLKKDFCFYFNASILNTLRGELKNEFYAYPLKAISSIIFVSTFANIFFTILLKKELTILGLIIRALLLFAGLAGLNSNADWRTIQNDSIILKLILKKKCAGFAEK